MQVLLCLVAFAAGVALIVQVAVNSTLRRSLGTPVGAAF